MSEGRYDLIVIGAGPGGYVAAARAARLGLRVVCVEKGALGGTCLNVGCIPSKALLESSELYDRARRGLDHHGIGLGEVRLDLGPMMARKEKIVRAMAQGIAALFRGSGVAHVTGSARLAGNGTVVVRDTAGAETRLTAERILLATGSVAVELRGLPFDGERVIGSTEALSLPAAPGRLLVIGGGAIGLELGSVWRRLGSEVVVVEYMEQLLPGMDAEMSGQLQRLLKRQGMTFRLGTAAVASEVVDGCLNVSLKAGGEELVETCDRALVAVGRRPATEGLGLEEAGVALDERGRVRVDDAFRTTVDGVYAIGDLVRGPMLAHKAEAEGIAAVEGMAGGPCQVNYDAIPGVVYTHPELASVGLSEEVAREALGEVKVGRCAFRANARAHCMDEIDGLAKVVCDPRTDRLLGLHVLGPQASNLIAEGALALEFSASAEDLARTVHAHPALSEVIKEAAWSTQE